MSIRICMGLVVVVVLSLLGAVGSAVALNPIMPPGYPVNTSPSDTTFYVKDDASGIAWLFFVNALINASIVSGAFLLSLRLLKQNVGIHKKSPRMFFATFVLAIIAITVIGALVDFYIVTETDEVIIWSGILGERPTEYYVHILQWGLLEWVVACALIFASVFGSMMAIHMRVVHSLFIGLVVTVFNPIMWLLTMHFGEDVIFISMILSVLSAPILLAGALKSQASLRPPVQESFAGSSG